MIRIIFRYRLLLITLCLLFLSMILMSSKINTDRFHFRTFLFSMVYTIENSIVTVYNSMKNVFANVKQIRTLESRLESAEQRLLRYRELTFLYEQLQKENENFRKMLNIQSRLNYKAYYSQVLFRDPSLLSDYIIINKGRKDGIKRNMPVVRSSEQDERLILVGKVIEVSHNASKVHLVTAKNFYIGVRLSETGYTGILSGQGAWNQDLLLNYIPIEATPQLGEEVITSGESEIYPAGLYIGKVRGIGQNVMEEYFQILYIKPELDYTKLSEVFVLNFNNNFQIEELTDIPYER